MSKELEITNDGIVKISYGMLGASLVLLFGFATWMAVMENRAQAHTEKIGILQEDADSLRDLLIGIDKRLARIEVLLERQINKER